MSTNDVTQYIGARYVPIFANPIEWDNTKEYEPLTIVTHEGNSYTSMQSVPAGIDISNSQFWALTGNFNAQVEQYRTEVEQVKEDVVNNTTDITELDTKVDQQRVDLTNLINAETSNRTAADENLQNQINAIQPAEEKTELVVFGDSWGAGDYSDWLTKLANDLGLNLHNYCVGSTRAENLQNQYVQFKNDTSFDKNKIKYMFLIYGVNDQWTYAVDGSTSYNAIASFITSVNSEIENPPTFYHFINFTWGFLENSPIKQGLYWNMNVCVNLEKNFSNYVYYNMMSWFNAQDMLEANNFHLNLNAQDRQLRYNIRRVLLGQEPVNRPSWFFNQKYTNGDTSLGVHMMQDIVDDGVEFCYIFDSPTNSSNISLFDAIPRNNVAPLSHNTLGDQNQAIRLAGSATAGTGQIGTYITTISARISANPNHATLPYLCVSGKLTWLSGSYDNNPNP